MDCKSPRVKFQSEKSDFSNPSSKNEITQVVSSRIETLLRISLSPPFLVIWININYENLKTFFNKNSVLWIKIQEKLVLKLKITSKVLASYDPTTYNILTNIFKLWISTIYLLSSPQVII